MPYDFKIEILNKIDCLHLCEQSKNGWEFVGLCADISQPGKYKVIYKREIKRIEPNLDIYTKFR